LIERNLLAALDAIGKERLDLRKAYWSCQLDAAMGSRAGHMGDGEKRCA
jgi:hypothetical protein